MEETSHNDWFNPECIDEQIEQLIQKESGDANESRLVRDLRQVYPDEREEEQASERIHERLTRYLAGELSYGTHEERHSSDEVWLPQQGRKRPMETPGEVVHKYAWTRQFAVLAAALIAVLLVGSLIFALRIVRTNSNVGKTNVPPQAQLAQPEMYISLNTPQNNQILKVDKQTGKVLWRFTVATNSQDPNGVWGPIAPVFVDGTAYFATQTGKLYALDAQTGKQRWVRDFQSSVGLDMANGVLYVSVGLTDQNGVVYALNPVNGTTEKTYKVSGWFFDIINGVMYIGSSSLNGTFTNGTGDALTAINVTTGQQLWQTRFDPQQRLSGEISIRGNVLYISSMHVKENIPNEPQDSYVYTLDIHTGQITWQSPLINGFIFHITVDNDGRVYFGAQNNHVYAFDPRTNQQLWQYNMTDEDVYAAPIIQNGIVYVAQDGHNSEHTYLAALDAATGTLKWIMPLNGSGGLSGLEALASSNDVIYVPTRMAVLGFSTSNGDKLVTIPVTMLLGSDSNENAYMAVLTITIM